MEDNFYIYVYLDPRRSGQYNYGSYEFEYEPFYVGKGKDDRINDKKNNHCEYKINKIRGLGFETIRRRIIENIEENYSFELEKKLIKLIGRENLKEGPLTNETDGGEGSSGYKHTEETLEKLRKEYPIIKKEFEKIKYTLKTEEKDYINAHQKLEYICDKGHEHSIRWYSFRQGKRCPVCAGKKIYFSEIKSEFENIKYTLKTKEKDYENNKQKLEYICDKGHEHSTTWANFQQGHKCPYCVGNKIDFSEIKNEFEVIRGCKLKTKEEDYENAHQKLEYICPNGHRHSICWNSFKQRKNNYCPKCNKIRRNKICLLLEKI